MQEGIGFTVSRILFFLLTLLVSAVVAYFSSTIIASLTVLLSTERLPRDFLRLMIDSPLVITASYVCVFFLSMVIFAHLLPSLHIWFHLTRAKKRLGELPLACDKLRQTTVKKFLATLEGLDFIHEFAVIYSEHLHQQPAEDVPEELLKKAKLNRALAKKDKNEKLVIEPVRASAPAASVFSAEQLVDQRLFLWFVEALPKILLATGGIILSVNILSLTIFDPALNVNMTTFGDFIAHLQPGLTAFVLTACAALLAYIFVKFSVGVLRQNATDLPALIDHLFHHDGWHAELQDMAGMMRENSLSKDVEKAIQRPLTAIGKATKALADDQGTKLEEFLSRALAAFEQEMEKNAGKQLAALTGSLEKAQRTAEKNGKEFFFDRRGASPVSWRR